MKAAFSLIEGIGLRTGVLELLLALTFGGLSLCFEHTFWDLALILELSINI